MNRWRNTLLAVLSHDASGLLIAAVVGLPFFGLAMVAPAALRWPLATLGVVLGVVLGSASIHHLWALSRARRATPPPGRLVDLGGYRVHLTAEGSTPPGRVPVIWFAGGHASGYAMHHLHRAFRGETRSILIDRPGTGWSDAGPFPRTTAREADEIVLALERAGEQGPFIWAGHSFGGLLAANIARRRPDLVHTLVLLDPTPLETIVFGPRLGALKEMRRTAWLGGFAQLFGVNLLARHNARMAQVPAYKQAMEATQAVLGPEVAAARTVEANAGNFFAQASIYSELSPEGVAAVAWDTVVYDRDLGDLPVWLVGPKDDEDGDIALLPEAQTGGAENARRMFHFFAATRERYLATSTRSRRIVAPKGAGHNFVYEMPDWTIAVMREAICGAPREQGP
ncbi:alpha/beta fold hydrolase [Ideonella sp. A 288]|uniref:alpha/beta fold hydrolase n=1 Tax=Ideonella sp. A 288 TaxID=1962181 RepID=UPI000B4BB51E|nr:alpha/beta hydrolase [Ideonella sp. A 288]